MKQLKHLIGKQYKDAVIDEIKDYADNHGLSVNIVPTDVDNIDIDHKRLNVWSDFNTGAIKKFTIG